MKSNNTPTTMNANEINARRYFINGKEVTANRYAAMKRLNAYIARKQAEAFSRGDMENIATRAAWFTYEAAADAEYGIARYIEDCRRFGYLKEETAPETTAPEFPGLLHTATNIVLTAENDGNIYRRHVQPLILSLVNRIKRGIRPDRKRLAQSAAMRAIIAASLAEMYCAGWMEDNTKVKATERKEAANYLAWSYISDAEDEYSNQMAAYK